MLDKPNVCTVERADSSLFTNQNHVSSLRYGMLFRTCIVRVANECELYFKSLKDGKDTPKLKIWKYGKAQLNVREQCSGGFGKPLLRFKKCINLRVTCWDFFCLFFGYCWYLILGCFKSCWRNWRNQRNTKKYKSFGYYKSIKDKVSWRVVLKYDRISCREHWSALLHHIKK